jgi:hypothetical protein
MPVTKTLPEVAGANFASLGANWRLLFVQPDGIPLTMAGLEVIDFGAISYKEVFQNVKTILATPLFTAALERTLGLDNTIVDRPITDAAIITVAILTAVNQWEPRCQIADISFEADPINGHLTCILQLAINNVIYGTNTPYESNYIFASPSTVIQGLPPMNVPVPGPIGPTGPRGSLWFVGATDPTAGLGTVGPITLQANDMYLNTTTGDVFQYTISSSTRGWQRVLGRKPQP